MAAKKSKDKDTVEYPRVIPDEHDWPIYKISSRREQLIEEVIAETMEHYTQQGGEGERNFTRIADAYYQERVRMKDNPWKVDRRDEPAFWRRIKLALQRSAEGGTVDEKAVEKILHQVVDRYTNEIAGDFRIRTYRFARWATNFGFTRLFNAIRLRPFRRKKGEKRMKLTEKMQLTGYTEEIRALSKKGVVILVPTHFSNLDSIVIGWAIEALGLPAFTYGAGINLFGHPILSYFMARLGAFRLDRRKKNEIYLTNLKLYTEIVLRKGGHMLFFPGGTRSRSGSIETKLKLGLLGTAIEAQRKLILEDPENYRRIYVVPLVMSYNTTLEATALINQFLKKEGKERYILVKDDFRSTRKTIKYIFNFLRSRSSMVFSFGKPMDLFGNEVNGEGISLDKQGRVIDLADYYQSNGEIVRDSQRSYAYTRLLGERILASYYRENIVFSSHLVAFTAFQFLLQTQQKDLYGLLTVAEEDLVMPYDDFAASVERLHLRLREMELQGKVRLGEDMRHSIPNIVRHGIEYLGTYHLKKPLTFDKAGNVITEDLRVLYFYHNRLNGYDLEKYL
ncbi:MAG: 1-acyl-sn-glycerol-3-phosphate acyltransferase [Bacteroidota bacterium]